MNLSELTYRTARALGIVEISKATGGSTTTIVDTVGRKEADNYWVGTGNKTSTVWIIQDAGGAGAAPEGEMGIVTGYTLTTPASTITFSPAMSVAVAASDVYAIAKKRYPKHILIQMINQALSDLGTIPYTDITTLTSGSPRTEYTIPVDANMDLRGVYVQGDASTTNSNDWIALPYSIVHGDIGEGNTVILPPLVDGRVIMLVYMRVHPVLLEWDDIMSELVHPDRVIYNAALKCLRWWQARTASTSPALMQQIRDLELEASRSAVTNPIRVPKRHSKYLYIGNTGVPST